MYLIYPVGYLSDPMYRKGEWRQYIAWALKQGLTFRIMGVEAEFGIWRCRGDTYTHEQSACG